MEVTAQKPNFLGRPMGIALTILALAMLWMAFPGNPTTLALLAICIIFLFGLNRPVWAMAALLVSQLTITSYMVNTPIVTISLRLCLLLLILIGFIIWRYRARNRIKLGDNAKRVMIPLLILTGLSIVSNLIYSGFDYAFKDFRNMAVGLLIIIFLPIVTRNLKCLKTLCGVVFIVMTTSALVAIMQHYNFLGMAEHTVIPGFLAQLGELRVPGMTETELELSYTLSIGALAILGILLVNGLKSKKWILVLSLVTIVLALYFTFTRSALFALALGLVALVLFLKTRIKGEIILVSLLLALMLIEGTGIMEGQYLTGRGEAVQEESSISRKILWQAGMAIAWDNPVLGIGGDQYSTVAPQYANNVDSSLLKWEADRYYEYRTLGSGGIHNDFLYMWVSYGILALITYLWLYFAMLRNFLHSYQNSSSRFVKGISLGLATGLVVYAANAFYHNCLATMPLFWIIAGFSVATAQLVGKRNSQYISSSG